MNSKDDILLEIKSLKNQLKESETERKEISKDYLDIVRRFNRLELENKQLLKENLNLRRLVYGREDNSQGAVTQ